MSLDRHQAFWDIDYNSGERYRFGPVSFYRFADPRRVPAKIWCPLNRGDYYTSQDLAELNRRLAATGWFNSVVVAPQFDKSRKTKVLPLQGRRFATQREHRGNRGRLFDRRWAARESNMEKKPWMNSYGHSLTSSISLSAPEQQFDFSYKVPLLKSPLEQYYLMQGRF